MILKFLVYIHFEIIKKNYTKHVPFALNRSQLYPAFVNRLDFKTDRISSTLVAISKL